MGRGRLMGLGRDTRPVLRDFVDKVIAAPVPEIRQV
jgi:hypothetical protein